MELDELREQGDKEWRKQKKALRSEWSRLISAPSEWLNAISWLLLLFAIAPPFLAIVELLNKPTSYLLPDGSLITTISPVTLTYGNYTLQQVAQFASRTEITHVLVIAGIISISLVIIAFALSLSDAVIQSHKRKKFVEQYIYEHGKSK